MDGKLFTIMRKILLDFTNRIPLLHYCFVMIIVGSLFGLYLEGMGYGITMLVKLDTLFDSFLLLYSY